MRQKVIYIVTNPHFKGWSKLGHTLDTHKRLGQYNCATPLKDYEIETIVKCREEVAQAFEQTVLAKCRATYLTSGEWIKCDKESLRKEILSIFEETKESMISKDSFAKKLIRLGNKILLGTEEESKDLPVDSLIKSLPKFNIDYRIFSEGSRQHIAFSFPLAYDAWIEQDKKRKKIKKNDLLGSLKRKSYFVEANRLKRISGTPIRCVILSMAPEDGAPIEILNLLPSFPNQNSQDQEPQPQQVQGSPELQAAPSAHG